MAKDADDLLVEQYKAVSDQIIHWDTFFWSKSRFFLAVEGVAFLSIVNWILNRIGTTGVAGQRWQLFGIFAAATLLNLYLCFVWLRTGVRNREFLNMRFEVGRAMEKYVQNRSPTFRLYTYQQWKIDKQKISKRRSHPWEIGIPLAFSSVWIGILGYVIDTYAPAGSPYCVLLWIGFWVLICFLLTEGWSAFKPPPEAAGDEALWDEFEKFLKAAVD